MPRPAKKKKRRARRPELEPQIAAGNLPQVAIVGRPNVGKSTLWNAWTGRRRAIVSATPGTTRDRLGAIVVDERDDGTEVAYELVDTGGLGVVDEDAIAREVDRQIETAVADADVLVVLMDVREGLLPLDTQVARAARRSGKPVVLAANKCERRELELEAANFAKLGLGEAICISAESRQNLDDLRLRVAELVPEAKFEEDIDAPPRIAIVGRRNAGKSTFLNALAGEERVVVSDLAGTTRDSVDVRVRFAEREAVLVDTAGLTRRREGKNAPDFFSFTASRRAIERAEAVLLILDATQRMGTIERDIGSIVNESYRAAVIVVNKWDLAIERGVDMEEFTEYVRYKLGMMSRAPIVYASARLNEHVIEAATLAADLALVARKRHPTSALNRMLQKALEERRPPSPRGELPRVYYATQTGVTPPVITVFVNAPGRFTDQYVRFMEARFREYIGQEADCGGEVPVKIILRARPRGARE